ncbi:hypothetical protein BDY19DRAFT_904279 [Irpex rosettiformis]|uniref:Uncharacterized protein n=1 Tax=Irpex rosettiformis TaxID=378272 RepID=A0ACB8UBM7_9APHY|nr:hypothetical protein BDY19DRAFT_904279 [Irpex rosettiformis]
MNPQNPPAYLPRGAACVVCRSKKIKCDGNRPKCNQCLRFGKEAECEYGDRPAPNATRVLEGQIAYLENKIRQFERERSHGGSRHGTSGSRTTVPLSYPTEPPPEVAQLLIRHFLPHARKVGCFVDLQRIFSPSQDTHSLSALRTTIYLWGARFSRDASYLHRESTFLANALLWLRHALASAQQQQRITLNLLQTEVLVAHYMFSNGRLLEGQSHYSAAVSLALTCGLHKLHTISATPSTGWLPASTTPAEDIEKVNAWWSIFTLEKSWAAFLDVPTMLTERADCGTVIETPWPRSSSARIAFQPGPSPGQTVKRFMTDVRNDPTSSPLALQAKAAILLNLSGEVASYQGLIDPQQLNNAIMGLDQAIEIFKTLLPPTNSPALSIDVAHELLLAHSITHAATIRLFKNTAAPNKDMKCLKAAFDIVRLISEANVQAMPYLHPALAMIWGTACDVLVPALGLLKANPNLGASSSFPRMDVLQNTLDRLRHAMAHFSASVPIFVGCNFL